MNKKSLQKKLALLITVAFLQNGLVFAESNAHRIGQSAVIHLKTGTQLTGTIVSWDDTSAKIETPEGPVDFNPSDVVFFRSEGSPAATPGSTVPATTGTAASNPIDTQKLAWEKDLSHAKGSRTALFLLGTAGAVAGIVIFSNGVSENKSAGDVPGCDVSGSTVLCADEQTTQQAQDKIDNGDRKMAQGIVVGLVGGILIVFGAIQQSKVNNLEAKGKRKGFALQLNGSHSELASLSYQIPF